MRITAVHSCGEVVASFEIEPSMPMTTDVRPAARAIADAAARWQNADFPPRVRITRALRELTGYTEPVVDYALDALFGAIDERAILSTIERELGDLATLERFVARDGAPDVTYVPMGRAAIVSSDTTIGVAIPALVFALCAGCTVDVKDRDDRLVHAFLETLAQEAPDLAAHATASAWDGADAAAAREHLADVDAAIAYGSDDALTVIRAKLPARARFVGFGHRTSVGYVTRAALASQQATRDAAAGAARDALLYDGEGCLSLHAVFVESSGRLSPAQFARELAVACDAMSVEFPAGYTDLGADVAAYLRASRFRASQGEGSVTVGALAPYAVTYEASHAVRPPLLRRTVAVYAIEEPSDALTYLQRHALPLEGLAFSCDAFGDADKPHESFVTFARASGASRTTTLGNLQRPPLSGEHGGAGRITPFLRAIYRG